MKVDEKWVQKEIRNSVLRESFKREIMLDESMASIGGKIADKFSKIPIIGKYGGGYLREYLFARVSQRFKLKKNETMGQFLSAAFKRLSFEDLGRIYSREFTCEETTSLLIEISSDVLTKKLVKSILIYLIQNYDLHDIMNKAINFDFDLAFNAGSRAARQQTFIPGTGGYAGVEGYSSESIGDILSQEFLPGQEFTGGSQALMSRNQANEVLNSLIGIVGQQFLEEMVLKFITSKVIPPVSEFICDDDTDLHPGASDSEKLDSKIDKVKGLTGTLDNLVATGNNTINTNTKFYK